VIGKKTITAAIAVLTATASIAGYGGMTMSFGGLSGDDTDLPLSGKVICIDPGHQGMTSPKKESIAPGSVIKKIMASTGTQGIYSKVPEYKLNLAVGNMLKKDLEAEGAKVVMTRTSNNIIMGNKERAFLANRIGADLTVRIHGDGSVDRSVHGMSVLIPGGKYIKDSKMISESRLAGKSILEHAVRQTGASSRGLFVRNDMTGFNWSKVPVMLIEVGFMTNRREDLDLAKQEYRAKVASGICSGVVSYMKGGKEQ
jgi:N-acetylmuramoyl-L-alanine amidase